MSQTNTQANYGQNRNQNSGRGGQGKGSNSSNGRGDRCNGHENKSIAKYAFQGKKKDGLIPN